MRLLVIRTSAMGDVALTLPALRAITEKYPDVEILMLTRQAFKPFFNSTQRISLFAADFNHQHKGLNGLLKLFIELSATGKFDGVIDLHDVLRSRILRFLFRLKGVPVHVIDKGRREKHDIISGKSKQKVRHSVERYLDVFKAAGLLAEPDKGPWLRSVPADVPVHGYLSDDLTTNNIGVAPYARHLLKTWPEDYMVALLTMLSENFRIRFIFFGGKEDSDRLNNLSMKVPGSCNAAGMLDLQSELELMSRLDLMIAMDSSNMHMAALSGVKVISIWGGTDPVSGFGAWAQPDEFFISVPFDKLECRPCTVFGKGECRRGDLACLKWLTPDIVYNAINGLKILK